jgi:ADP-ribose pyrophosphatase YjhB (NUDIX family)
LSKKIKVKYRNKFATNKVFNLYFDAINDKNNNVYEDNYLVIETHHTLDDFTGVSILPVKDNSVLLIKIYRHAIQKEIFEVPRGFVDNNDQSIKLSALRELREETFLECKDEDITFIHGMYPEPGILRAKIALFIAYNCFESNINETSRNELGHYSYKYFSRDEVGTMINEPENFDTTTFILLKQWLQNKSRN